MKLAAIFLSTIVLISILKWSTIRVKSIVFTVILMIEARLYESVSSFMSCKI